MVRLDQSRRRARIVAAAFACTFAVIATLGGVASSLASPTGGGAALRVEKSVAGSLAVPPGGSTTFIINVSNFGGATATGARLLDALPPGLTAMIWSCTGASGATCANASASGPIDEALDGLNAGGQLVFDITASVAATPPPFVTNTALVTVPAGSRCVDDATPPCRAEATVATGSNIEVGFVTSPASAQAGQAVSFVIDFRAPTAAADGTLVRIPVATGLVGATWSCVGSDGAVCPVASGSGAVEQTVGNWAAGGLLRFTFDATVVATPPVEIAQSALAIPPFGGSCGSEGGTPPCTAVSTVPVGARIDISKTGELNAPLVFYSINLENRGADAGGSVFTDALPTGVAFFNQWTCSAGNGAVCPQAVGSGPINETIAIWPTGGTFNYSITAQLDVAPPAQVINTASLAPPAGARCGTAASAPPCVATSTTGTASDTLTIAFDTAFGYAAPGSTLGLGLTIDHPAASVVAAGSQLEVPVPGGFSAFESWTCTPTGPAACPASAGSGPISASLGTFGDGGRLAFSIIARVATVPPADFSVVATLTPPAGVGCEFGAAPPCTATQLVTTAPLLEVTKTTSTPGLVAGGAASYDLFVRNTGIDASAVRIVDPLPTGLASATWTCTSGYVTCPNASGSGAIDETLAALPTGASLAYRIDAIVAAAPPAVVTNTVTVTTADNAACLDAEGASTAQPCVASVSGDSLPLIELTQTAAQTQVLRGGTARYTVTLRNRGTTASAITLSDPLPTGIARFDWQCRGYTGAVCPTDAGNGALAQTIAVLPAGGRLAYTIDALVAVDAPASIVNIASVTPPSGGGCDPVDCTATVALPVSLAPAASIAVSKAANVTTAPPGSAVAYTIDVRNLGSVSAGSVRIEDPLPNGLAGMTWTCAGVECPAASGTGPLVETLPLLAPFVDDGKPSPSDPGRVVYAIGATVVSTPPPVINNIATLVPSGEDACAFGACTSTASVTTGVVGQAILALESQPPTVLPLLPGQAVGYTVGIVNTGNADAGETTFSNPVPNGLAGLSWTCAATGTAKCPLSSGSGAIQAVIATVPVGARLTYAVAATVAAAPPAAISNTSIIKPPSGALCSPVGCLSTFDMPVDLPDAATLTLTKVADRASVDAGGAVNYTVTLANNGLTDANASTLNDPVPAGIATFAWTCTATNTATCPLASGTGAIGVTSAIPQQSSLVFQVSAVVAGAGAPAVVVNTATVVPGADVTCNPACTASVSLPLNASPTATLTLSKTADQGVLQPGAAVTYTVTVGNSGGADAGPTTLSDPVPAGLGAFAWTCAATNDATCPASSGTGSIAQTISVPLASALVYTVQATVATSPPASIANTASLSPPAGVGCIPASCTVTRTLPVASADILVDKRATPVSGTPLQPGQLVTWTLRAVNSGSPSSAPLTLVDNLPANVRDIRVVAGNGSTCSATTPAPGSTLTCSIAAGFTGTRSITVAATVTAADGQGQLRNTLAASGADTPACSPCATTHPVGTAADVGVGNARPFNAAGIAGTLVDIINLTSTATPTVSVTIEPASAQTLFGVYSGGCTATPGTGGAVTVSCPSPPSAQGIQCSGATCTIQSLPASGAATVFVALQAGATLRASVAGDTNPGNNAITLPPGGSP